jgi:hypothetical protein
MVRTLSFLILIVFLSAIFVSAQDEAAPPPLNQKTQKTKAVLPSLKTLPTAKRFTDPARTFSLWMPAKPTAVTVTPQPDPQKGAAKTRYTWILAEGFFAISKSIFAQRTFDTDEDIASIVTPLKNGIGMDPDMKLSSEKNISLGKWRGTELVFDQDSTRTFMHLLARGKEVYVLVSTVNVLAPNTEKLIVKAMNSFKITEITPRLPRK